MDTRRRDTFGLSIRGIQAGIELEFRASITPKDGEPFLFQDRITDADGDRTGTDLISPHRLPQGTITSWTWSLIQGTVPTQPGEVWLEANLIRRGLAVGALVSGYYYGGYLPIKVESSVDGPGRMVSVALGDPAAGADFTAEAVPANALWRLRGIAFQLVTDANAADRHVRLDITDGTRAVAGTAGARNPQTASLTVNWVGGEGVAKMAESTVENAAGGTMVLSLPTVRMPAGYTVAPIVVNKQAGDNLGAGFLLVEEWMNWSMT